MKQILFLLLTCLASSLYGQDSTQEKHIMYKVRVSTFEPVGYTGYLASFSDSAIFLSEAKLKYLIAAKNTSGTHLFGYHELENVWIQRKSSASRGFAIGAISSFAALQILILATQGQQFVYNFNYAEKTIFIALPGAILGGLIGLTIGALIHHRFIINGMSSNFLEMKKQMEALVR